MKSETTRALPAASMPRGQQTDDYVQVAGAAFVGDPAGALYWPEQGLLAVADLHLEKGSASPRAACCCRLMTPPPPWRGWRG